MQPVAGAAQAVYPSEGRRVRIGMADDNRRGIGGGVRSDDPVEPLFVEAHVAPFHVAPGSGPTDVDPPVERAHERPRVAPEARGATIPPEARGAIIPPEAHRVTVPPEACALSVAADGCGIGVP